MLIGCEEQTKQYGNSLFWWPTGDKYFIAVRSAGIGIAPVTLNEV
jgi:hypothetical protein